MNSQPMRRAAVCAALVIVCLASAGWRSVKPVAGQEPKPVTSHGASVRAGEYGEPSPNTSPEPVVSGDLAQIRQIYRPGLRNSFAGHPLNANELNLVLTHLRHKTGFVRMRFDEAGFLTIDDRMQIVGGSATARELLLAAVDGRKSINLQSHNRSPRVVFARVGVALQHRGWRSDTLVESVPVEIDFDDFGHLRGDRKAMEAFDLGFAILHELCHAVLELHDPAAEMNAAGDCESYVNRIRRELGMPERQRYAATTRQRMTVYFGSIASTVELVFAQTEPGRESGSHAKTKRLRLRWNVQRVGKIHWLSASPAVDGKTSTQAAAP